MLDELLEGEYEIFNQLEFVVIHICRQVEVRLSWANAVKLNRMLMRYKRVFLSMKEENGTLGF